MRMLVAALLFMSAWLGIALEAARATTASVTANGTVLVDGQPFFPIGMYHVSWIGGRQADKAIPDLDVIADAGMNLVHPTIDMRATTEDFLDRAFDLGVRVIGEVPWPENGPADFVSRWKSHPAIIGWLIADDFNTPFSGPPRHSAAEVLARNQLIAGIDPDHLSYASGGSYPGFRVSEYAGTVELMGFQHYPIAAGNSEEDYWLEEGMDGADYVAAQLAGSDQAIIANPQAFRWDGARWPTPREARNLLYQPLLRGAKGVLWYTFWDGRGPLDDKNPPLWAEIHREVIELKSLQHFFLHGDRTDLASSNERVHASSFELDGQLLVIALSTERTSSHAVSLAAAGAAEGPAHVVFPWRAESGCTVAGGLLSFTIGPEETHVYLIDLPVPGNASPTAVATASSDPVAFGELLAFDAAGSADADGSVVAWQWDFGDGELASGATVQHAYADPGTHYVRLTVRDDAGAASTALLGVQVGITSLCAAVPLGGCEPAGRSNLSLSDPGVASRRSLRWKWSQGAAALADFGSPETTTEIALCVYDASGQIVATGSRPDATRWRSLGASGFSFSDRTASPGGLRSARLRPGSNSASILLKGKGRNLPGPTPPLALPVTVQMVTSDTRVCWTAAYAGGAGTRNVPGRFSARSFGP